MARAARDARSRPVYVTSAGCDLLYSVRRRPERDRACASARRPAAAADQPAGAFLELRAGLRRGRSRLARGGREVAGCTGTFSGLHRRTAGTASFTVMPRPQRIAQFNRSSRSIIPALNEAGKIGRVLDKFPRDGRFEAIVVDDGSIDGTGDEAREHGAAGGPTRRPRRRRRRDPGRLGRRDHRKRPYLALLSGDDQHEPGEMVAALDTLLAGRPTTSRARAGSRRQDRGRIGGRGPGHADLLVVFSILSAGASPMPRTASGSSGRRSSRTRRSNSTSHGSMSYELEPYVLYKAIRAGYRVIESR